LLPLRRSRRFIQSDLRRPAAGVVTRKVVSCSAPFPLPGGLDAQLFAVPGKALYIESENPALDTEIGANVGVEHPRL